MALLESMPEPLELSLAQDGSREDLLATLATDVDPQGCFGEEWLVLTPQRLRVFHKNGKGYQRRLDLPVGEIKSARAESMVGGGALVATANGTSHEVLRFSNAQQKKFNRLAKYLNDSATYEKELKEKGKTEKEKPRLEKETEEEKRCPKCNLILPEGSKRCPACMSKTKAIARMLTYFRPHWSRVALITALMFLGLLLQLVNPYLARPLTDTILAPKGVPLPVDERVRLLGWLVLAGLSAQALGVVIGIWRGWVSVALGMRLSHELRLDVFRHLQRLSLKFFDKRQTGALMARVTRDTHSMESVLVDGVQHFFSNIFLFLLIGAVLLYENWRLTLLVFIPVPVVLVLSRLFWKRMMTVWRRAWHLYSRMSAMVNDSLTGIRVVRAFAKEQREVGRFEERSGDVYRADEVAQRLWVTLFPVLFLIMGVGSQIVWYVGGQEILGDTFTLGQLISFTLYLGMFYGPLHYMSRMADYMSRSLAAAERVFEVLDTDPEIKDAADAVAMPRLKGHVEFKDVTFGYDEHKPVLKGVTFEAKPGEMIGLVGQSGAGKSTTINLVCRFYEVNEGRILIDGVDIKKVPQQDLRSQIGVVLQEPFLFSGTIYENIAFAKPEATPEDVMAAAKAAHAHDFIVKKPDGYDTVVGERGQTLSGGERQRVSIARAILHDPRILILDEATASVDTDTEKKIQDAIKRLVKGRTTFAIAHRLSTLRNADRLLVLKDGKIAESGTHEELLEKKGEFQRLVKMQQEMSTIVEVGG